MILALFTLDSAKHLNAFDGFSKLTRQRYASLLAQPLEHWAEQTWFCTVKPYHAEAFPFITLDMLVQLRGLPCHLFFGHDMVELDAKADVRAQLGGPLLSPVKKIIDEQPDGKSHMRFQGFGPRIDLALNALAVLYIDLLASLTKVEAEVIHGLRELQYAKHGSPIDVRSFGLQKQVAAVLGKSPVAIHKSLRSAKFELIAETATAMKQIMG